MSRDHYVYVPSQWETVLYSVTPSLNGWAHTQNDPWVWRVCCEFEVLRTFRDVYYTSLVRSTPGVLLEPLWRNQMETFGALLALCEGNTPAPILSVLYVTRSFHFFFDLRPNKRLSKQSRCPWFETPPCSLWRHCNALAMHRIIHCIIRGNVRTRFHSNMSL